jgi:MoxR-like ATPase
VVYAQKYSIWEKLMNQDISKAKQLIATAIHGKDDVINTVLCTIFAGGHILLEDIPGVGKTTLVTALAKVLNMDYKRIQFTPDVLPSDILGFTMYDKNTGEFTFKEGVIYTNLFLADEINRTSPKTQSALLEVMEEGRATVDGVTRPMPKPFFVIATQNPIGSSGTQKLPESQLDRFMVRLTMGYPDHESSKNILRGDSHQIIDQMESALTKEDLLRYKEEVEKVFTSEEMYEYIISLTEATRVDYTLGLSPRGSIALHKMAKANAFIEGRNYITPDDVKAVFYPVANHRVILSNTMKSQGTSVRSALSDTLASVPMPRIKA